MRLEPENDHLNLPLNVLATIKANWHGHPNTCINISSADMLQFAIFFAVTRQSGTPESLLSGTAAAVAKRASMKTDFLWGRPDEIACDTMWVGSLPGFSPPNDGTIPGPGGRCAAAVSII